MTLASNIDDDEILSLGTHAVAAATTTVLAMFERPDSLDVRVKSTAADLVSRADMEGERIVREVILGSRPDDSFVGEEGTKVEGSSPLTWVLDPVDSTANFVRGIPIWSISLAAMTGGVVVAGIVAFPPGSETYSAHRSTPVMLNGRPVDSPPPRPLSASMLAIGWGPKSVGRRHGLVADRLIPLFGKVRSPGSPALGLSWTAIGRFDAAFYEMDFSDWDVRAGAFLCQRAGLRVEEHPPAVPGASRRLLAAPHEHWSRLSQILDTGPVR